MILSLSRFASWDWVEKGFNLQLIIILLKSCVWVGGGCEREREAPDSRSETVECD